METSVLLVVRWACPSKVGLPLGTHPSMLVIHMGTSLRPWLIIITGLFSDSMNLLPFPHGQACSLPRGEQLIKLPACRRCSWTL